MKLYIIAGEASGDLHGGNLIKELKTIDSSLQIRCWGGDQMQSAGGQLVKHYKDTSFMGFVEVIKHLPQIFKLISFCKNDLLEYKPDALILIDYPGFNLKIAEFAHSKDIPVYYYISPKVWAWKKKRVFKIKKWVNKMYTILPFETEFYKKYNYPVHYVGHPLLDAIETNYSKEKLQEIRDAFQLDERPVIACLPGSRKMEIQNMFPIMTEVSKKFSEFQFVVAATSWLSKDLYQKYSRNSDVRYLWDSTYDLLKISDYALVTSGTATLETCLFGVPQVVCYKGNSLSFEIAKRIVDVKYISLVNLIADKEVVKELIQYDLSLENVEKELRKIMNTSEKKKMIEEYHQIVKSLGTQGASKRIAQDLLKTIH